jgi:hypothetical protein
LRKSAGILHLTPRLSESAVEEVRRHSASYAEQNLVATIDNLRQRLQEVETELEGARAQIEQIRR